MTKGKSKAQKKKAKQVSRKLAVPTVGLSLQTRVAMEVVADQRAEAEGAAVRDGLLETARLEAARSGERRVQGVPKAGQLRLRSRDGLDTLRHSGAISEVEAAAGYAYRLCFEAAATGLQPGRGDMGGVASAGGPRDPVMLQHFYLVTRLNQMERAVGAAIEDGRELLALRLVAGEGRTIRSICGGENADSKRKAAYTVSLRRALAVIADLLGMPKALANRPR